MKSVKDRLQCKNLFDVHKRLIKHYIQKPDKDCSNNGTVKIYHKFLWDKVEPLTWEEQLAKAYYDKLFKEFCIGDLSKYKENKIALRWRTENEVVNGKGQFICGNKSCSEEDKLRSWEVNFAYKEDGLKKNALVKIKLCTNCSVKLNYHKQKKEVKRLKNKKKTKHKSPETENGFDLEEHMPSTSGSSNDISEESVWEKNTVVEAKSREEEMEDYLDELLF